MIAEKERVAGRQVEAGGVGEALALDRRAMVALRLVRQQRVVT